MFVYVRVCERIREVPRLCVTIKFKDNKLLTFDLGITLLITVLFH